MLNSRYVHPSLGGHFLILVAIVYRKQDEGSLQTAGARRPLASQSLQLCPFLPRQLNYIFLQALFLAPRLAKKSLPHYTQPIHRGRVLVALTTFSDLVGEARTLALKDALAMMPDDGRDIDAVGSGAAAYADAIVTYLAFAVDRSADRWCSLATWQSSADFVRGTFARQDLPMVWDYADANPFSSSTSNWLDAVEWVAKCLDRLPQGAPAGRVKQLDAATSINGVNGPLVATDPPYYDNIGYADLLTSSTSG